MFHMHKTNGCCARTNARRQSIQSGVGTTTEIKPIKNEDYGGAEEIDNPMEVDQTVSSGIGVWTADVKNCDCSSSNREEDAITSDDQMPNGNTQFFALRRERKSQWQCCELFANGALQFSQPQFLIFFSPRSTTPFEG